VSRVALATVAAALAAALTLAGCTGTAATTGPDEPLPASATPSTPARSQDATGGTSTAPPTLRPSTRLPRLDTAQQFRTVLPTGMRVVGLTLAGSRLAWSGCLPCAGTAQDATDVYVADLSSGRLRSVARTRFRWGSTSVVGLTGETLVWLDGADVRDGDSLRSRWALRALDLRSSASWTIAEGRPGESPRQPVAFVRDGRVTWQLFDLVAGSGPVSSADVRTHKVRTVTRRLPGRLRAVTARWLVYTAKDPDAPTVVPDAPVPADAFLLPARGGDAVALTTTHDVADATAVDARLVWSTPHGNGEALWSGDRPGAPAALVFTGPVLSFVAGSGFVAWITREPAPVVQLGDGGPPLVLPDVPAEGGMLAADGDRLALVTVPDRGMSGPLTLVITRVSVRS
jgi:hypothetical protein